MMTTPTLQFVPFVLKLLQGQVSKAHQVSVCVKAKPNPSFENKRSRICKTTDDDTLALYFSLFLSNGLLVFIVHTHSHSPTHIHPGVCLYPRDTKWRAIKY